jgi:hypothetical protein
VYLYCSLQTFIAARHAPLVLLSPTFFLLFEIKQPTLSAFFHTFSLNFVLQVTTLC